MEEKEPKLKRRWKRESDDRQDESEVKKKEEARLEVNLVPRPLYACGARFLPRRNKGLVSTVLCMCQFKTNEYTQTMLLGVELLRMTFYL